MDPLIKGLLHAGFFCLLAVQAHAVDVTLRFSWWGEADRHEATIKALRLFEAANPGVKVRAESMPFQGYYERLDSLLAKGGEPDVMQINWAWISAFSPKGDGFYDINQTKGLFDLANEYPGGAFKSGMVNGKLNALPVSMTARVFMWQKPAFDRAGIAIPKTWDELFAAGRTFEQKLGKEYYPLDGNLYDVLLLAHSYTFQRFGKPYIYSNQSKVAYSVDEAQEWVRFYKRLASEHVVVPLSKRLTAGGQEVLPERTLDWQQGRWVGIYGWDSTLQQRQVSLPKNLNLTVGDFVSLPGARHSGVFGRPSQMLAISKRSKHPEVAARLVHFILFDPAAIRVLGTQRGIPLARTPYAIIQKERGYSPGEQKAQELIASEHIELPSPFREHPRIQSFLREVFEDVSFDRLTDKAAAERLVNEGNKILREIR